MAPHVAPDRSISISRGELTGAVGDSLTVLPIVVALAIVTDISLPHVLIAFGLFQIVWGFIYGLPMSVEPMKALAALAIAGALGYAELALAGVVLGLVLLAIGASQTLSIVERWIGRPVIRGIQFAVGLVLLETAVDLSLSSPALAAIAVVVAAVFTLAGRQNAVAIVLLAAGLAIALVATGLPVPRLPGLPAVPALAAGVSRSAADGIAAQLAMTIGNAALATSLLVSDLFDREVSPDRLSASMGVMNLLAVPIGGIPMCHGCDGVAGKHAFGARTGGANLVLGVLYVGAAFVLTTAVLSAFPLAILGVLLGVVSVSLASHVRESDRLWLSVAIGLAALVTNLGVAFVIGALVDRLVDRYRAEKPLKTAVAPE